MSARTVYAKIHREDRATTDAGTAMVPDHSRRKATDRLATIITGIIKITALTARTISILTDRQERTAHPVVTIEAEAAEALIGTTTTEITVAADLTGAGEDSIIEAAVQGTEHLQHLR